MLLMFAGVLGQRLRGARLPHVHAARGGRRHGAPAARAAAAEPGLHLRRPRTT